eukprot:1271959-Ditylum_brightwellii.AAC.1
MAAVLSTHTTIKHGIKAYLAADFDFVQDICQLNYSGLALSASWVKAHQEDKKPWEELSPDAHSNCITDEDATRLYLHAPSSMKPPTIPMELQSNKDNADASNIWRYKKKKTGMPDRVMDTVEWDSLGHTLMR